MSSSSHIQNIDVGRREEQIGHETSEHVPRIESEETGAKID